MEKNRLSKEDILMYLQSHKEEFNEAYDIESIGLFGSFARGEETNESDIDIFVKMKPTFFKLVAFQQKVQEDLKRKVDVIREHNNIKPLFLKMIKKDICYV